MVGSGRRVRARGALPSREGLLIVALGLWILMPGAESLFGFGGGKKKGASKASGAVTEVESTGASEVGTAAQEACIADMGTEKVGNAGMGKWEGADGKLHPIRAERRPSGLWEFPVGTVVPKDPTSMTRIVSVANSLGEHFQCLLPGRKRPPNPLWIDVPQVPVVEPISTEKAEAALKPLEGKCFYKQDVYWTYEFCYRSHVRQFRLDPNNNAVEEEYLVGRFNASVPFEVLTQPDRTDHTQHLDQEGPAWTTALLTRYGGGDLADQWGSGWYSAEWVRRSLFGVLPIKRWAPRNLGFKRPRQAAVTFKCLLLEDENKRMWLDNSNLYLDGEHVPFDIEVLEVGTGIYDVVVRSEALCASPLLRLETVTELDPFGDILEDVVCQSEESGEVYPLRDVPGDDRFYHKFRQALSVVD